jgi:FkbM family methyltransferase
MTEHSATQSLGGLTERLVTLVRRSQDRWIVRQVIKPLGRRMMMPIWKRRARQFYRSIVKPGQLVFDVGANEGDKAQLFLAAGARVVCFEPQGDLVAGLRQRFAGRPVQVVETALGATPGVMRLHLASTENTVATLSTAWKDDVFTDYVYDRQVNVAVSTLDDEIARVGQPHFIKIDVEGFELDVLRGLTRRVPLLSIEWVARSGDSTAACIQYLSQLGYRRFNVGLGETYRFAFADWVDADALSAYLRTPASGLPWAWGDVYARA